MFSILLSLYCLFVAVHIMIYCQTIKKKKLIKFSYKINYNKLLQLQLENLIKFFSKFY